MDVTAIHTELKQGTTRKFYIFTGPEWAVQEIYIKQISRVAKKDIKYIEGITSIKQSKSSFIHNSYVYVARDDKEFITTEKLQNNMNKYIDDNIFILLLTNADKRTKFYKKYAKEIIDFEPLKDAVLKKYIQKDIKLSDENCDILMGICEHDYGRILLEINKINTFAHKTGSVNKAFSQLVREGVIYKPPKDAVFDLVDAILDKRVRQAWRLYEDCKAIGEASMVIVSVLYNNTKAVLQVQSCTSKDVSQSTGLTGWQIMNAKKHTDNYKNRELIHIMELCQKCEQGVKMGTIKDSVIVSYIMSNIL